MIYNLFYFLFPIFVSNVFVIVLPIDMANEHDTHEMFQKVDVRDCKCFIEAERQKLLAIVEQVNHNGHQLQFNYKVFVMYLI